LYTIDLQCFSGPKVTLLGVAGQIFPIEAQEAEQNND